jgi:tRNA threonylcarbamoyladenosine biosynthesis protein TsaB
MLEGARQHAAGLFPLIEQVLGELGGVLADVDTLVLSDGPGSFTGLRVGAAAAKALARSRPGFAIWSASTLMVRAAGAAAMRGARVLVATSALRGELYAASYRVDLPRAVTTLLAPTLATPESLHGETPDLLVADAPDKLVDRLADQFAVPLIRGGQSLPTATALLSLLGVAGGAEPIAHPESWEPRYGRLAEAQIRWEAAHGRALSNPSSLTR